MSSDTVKRHFEKKHGFKATSVISEIIKSANSDLVADLCNIDEEIAQKGMLHNVWNKNVLPIPDLSAMPTEKDDKAESTEATL
jgi:hypothetical protein